MKSRLFTEMTLHKNCPPSPIGFVFELQKMPGAK